MPDMAVPRRPRPSCRRAREPTGLAVRRDRLRADDPGGGHRPRRHPGSRSRQGAHLRRRHRRRRRSSCPGRPRRPARRLAGARARPAGADRRPARVRRRHRLRLARRHGPGLRRVRRRQHDRRQPAADRHRLADGRARRLAARSGARGSSWSREHGLELAILLLGDDLRVHHPVQGRRSPCSTSPCSSHVRRSTSGAWRRCPAEQPHLVGPARSSSATCRPGRAGRSTAALFALRRGVDLARGGAVRRGARRDRRPRSAWTSSCSSSGSRRWPPRRPSSWSSRCSPGAATRRPALGTLVSSKVNQWTLLVGDAAARLLASASGRRAAMPLDPPPAATELLLTAAQSLFAVALLLDLRLSLGARARCSGCSSSRWSCPTRARRSRSCTSCSRWSCSRSAAARRSARSSGCARVGLPPPRHRATEGRQGHPGILMAMRSPALPGPISLGLNLPYVEGTMDGATPRWADILAMAEDGRAGRLRRGVGLGPRRLRRPRRRVERRVGVVDAAHGAGRRDHARPAGDVRARPSRTGTRRCSRRWPRRSTRSRAGG